MIFAVAASVLIVVGFATWAMLRQHDQRFARPVVDLRDRSISRGTEPPPTEPPIEIGRGISARIYLPLGPTMELRIVPRNGDPLFSGNAVATLKAGITPLRVDANLSSIRPGRYVLQLRRPGSDWNSYPLHIK